MPRSLLSDQRRSHHKKKQRLSNTCVRQGRDGLLITYLSINLMRKGEILQIVDQTLHCHLIQVAILPDACKAGERKVPLNSNARAAYERLKPVIDDVYTPGLFRWWMNKVRRDVGRGDKHFVFHVGRHTTATRLASNKENEFNIADIMGHQVHHHTQICTSGRGHCSAQWKISD